jgi:UDP-3-O-acyl-N-acetylglucosamine deacetylase
LVFDERGVIDNRLRYADECARHKTLDLIGDLSLVGVDLIGRFISFRGGHVLNAAMARTLARRLRAGSPTVEPRRAAA